MDVSTDAAGARLRRPGLPRVLRVMPPGVRNAIGRNRWVRYVVVRLGTLILLMFGVTIITFVLTNLVPSDPAYASLGPLGSSNPEAVAAFRQEWGLDRPVISQYFVYLNNLLHGNLGISQVSNQPVFAEIRKFLPATIELGVVSMFIAVPIGVVAGLISVVRLNTWVDQLIRVVTLAGLSVPIFWLGLIAIYGGYFELGWFPSGGRLAVAASTPPSHTGFMLIDTLLHRDFSGFTDALHHILLPALVLAAFNIAVLTRFTRAAALEVHATDYVRTARAKGISATRILFVHVLRAALPSIVNLTGLLFANVLVGAVLVEQVFSWPGFGAFAYRSATSLDLPAITGASLVVALVYVVVNLLVDMLLQIIDPRVTIVSGGQS